MTRASEHPNARKPSRLAKATAAAVAIGGISAATAAAPGAMAATRPPTPARAETGGKDVPPAGLARWLHQPPGRPASASAALPRSPSAALWETSLARAPYARPAALPRDLHARERQPSRSRPARVPAPRAAANIPRRFAAMRHSPAAPAPRARQAARHPAARKAPTAAEPYLIYDSVQPAVIPAGQDVATYADGPYAVSPAAVAGRGRVLWIDVNGSDLHAAALDVEPGDAAPADAPAWAAAKLGKYPHSAAIIYTDRAWWPAVKAGIRALPRWMRSRVRYWIADPTGYPHSVPGASATQWYWGPGYDISTAQPGFPR